MTSHKKIRFFIIQLSGLSDVLQSLMALKAIKQLYPEIEIHLLVRECFSDTVKRIKWIEKSVFLPAHHNLETQSIHDFAEWIAPLTQTAWDFVVNWTYSESSSYLAALIPGYIKIGYTRQKNGQLFSPEGWSHYIQAVVQRDEEKNKIEQNIHITDILTTQVLTALQIHVGEPTNPGATAVTGKDFFEFKIDENKIGLSPKDYSKKWICVEPLSKPSQWELHNWERLVSLIKKDHPECLIFILGDEKIGNDFDTRAFLISKSHWVISESLATLHLACVFGTRSLYLSHGKKYWRENGPYGNGHYVLHADQAENLTVESVYLLWAYGYQEWAHQRHVSLKEFSLKIGLSEEFSAVQPYRTKIRTIQDGGGVYYEPLLLSPVGIQAWLSQVMGHIARSWYCGWAPQIGQELHRQNLNPDLIKFLRELEESVEVLRKIFEEAKNASLAMSVKYAQLPSEKLMKISDRDEIQALGNKLKDLDELAARLGQTHLPLLAFSHMKKVLMHNIRGQDLKTQGQEGAEIYEQLLLGLGILKDWVVFSLRLSKPMVVQNISQETPIISITTKKRILNPDLL